MSDHSPSRRAPRPQPPNPAPEGPPPGESGGRAKRRRMLSLLLPPVILAAAAAGFAGLKASKPTPPAAAAEEKTWPVEVIQVTPGRQVPELILYGSVESPRQAALTAAVAADVLEVKVMEGDRVPRGAPLVILDDRDIALTLRSREADLADARAQIASEQHRFEADQAALQRERALLTLARRAVTRNLDLSKKKMAAESALDEARQALERQALAVNERELAVTDHQARLARLEASRDRAQALLEMARLDLERTRIRAPFDGRVTETPVAPGDRARVGDRLLTLYPTDGLEVRAQIPYRELQPIRQALDAGFTLRATAIVDGTGVEAHLDRLAGAADRASGGIDGLFRITEGAEALAPGRLVSLRLALPPVEQAVMLPSEALYGLRRVYRVEQGRMRGLQVERAGERRGESAAPATDASAATMQVLVRSPALRSGDRIVVTALPNAANGLKVRIVEPRTETPDAPSVAADPMPAGGLGMAQTEADRVAAQAAEDRPVRAVP